MELKGYKAFSKDLHNKYNQSFEIGKTYQKDASTMHPGKINHGYHFSRSLPDTFRFFNPTKENIYCEVIASGKIIEIDHNLYNSDTMYIAEKIRITKILSRSDIVNLALTTTDRELERFLALFPFTKEELILLKNHLESEDMLSNLGTYSENSQKFQRNIKYLRRDF